MENALQSKLRRAANDRIFESVVVEGGENGYFACSVGAGPAARGVRRESERADPLTRA
jgi:hypothetical protein